MARFKKAVAATVEGLFAPQEGEQTPLPKYRANHSLVFGDLIADTFPEAVGTVFAQEGDITELYYPVRAYPDRVQRLIDLGAITPIGEGE